MKKSAVYMYTYTYIGKKYIKQIQKKMKIKEI